MTDNMTKTEYRATIGLALIFVARMLGLFMILPVFALYADDLPGATPFLIGLALGIYGLTQAALQIPFGTLSDRIGRKPLIITGLCLFAIGSVIAALSTSIYGVIIGRALQGGGAIGSVVIATVADLTRDQHRTKAMALIGMSIGLSFSFAMVAGPLLNAWIGVPGIFWLTALLALVGMLVLFTIVPTPTQINHNRDTRAVPELFKQVLHNKELLRLDVGIFMQHAILTATFVAVPVSLQQLAGMNENQQWQLYLPVLALAFFTMVPFIIIAEKKRKMKPIFVSAIGIVAFAQLGLFLVHDTVAHIAMWLFIYFTAFNLLEASLPSLVSKMAPAGSKGTAMGVYSTSQFLGIFVGGSAGGWLFGHHHAAGVFLMCAIFAVIWISVAIRMKHPRYFHNEIIEIGHNLNKERCLQLSQRLSTLPGVAEVVVIANEGIAYMKVDKTQFDHDSVAPVVQAYC